MKKIVFYKSLEDQRRNFLSYADNLTYVERLQECLRLTRKAFWKFYQSKEDKSIKKIIKVYKGRKGETLEDFYKRVKS